MWQVVYEASFASWRHFHVVTKLQACAKCRVYKQHACSKTIRVCKWSCPTSKKTWLSPIHERVCCLMPESNYCQLSGVGLSESSWDCILYCNEQQSSQIYEEKQRKKNMDVSTGTTAPTRLCWFLFFLLCRREWIQEMLGTMAWLYDIMLLIPSGWLNAVWLMLIHGNPFNPKGWYQRARAYSLFLSIQKLSNKKRTRHTTALSTTHDLHPMTHVFLRHGGQRCWSGCERAVRPVCLH